MSFCYLPYGGLEWLSKREIDAFDLDSVPENSLFGYVLEVYLNYCEELHDKHNDLPLAPEKVEVKYDMLSKYCRKVADCYGIKVGGVKKLVANLLDKVEYIAHYENLKYYLSLGMGLIKIHRILKFKQSYWLKPYVDINTKKDKKVMIFLIKIYTR